MGLVHLDTDDARRITFDRNIRPKSLALRAVGKIATLMDAKVGL